MVEQNGLDTHASHLILFLSTCVRKVVRWMFLNLHLFAILQLSDLREVVRWLSALARCDTRRARQLRAAGMLRHQEVAAVLRFREADQARSNLRRCECVSV